MALGDQVKALIIVSKAKDWDPTVILGTGDSIANFNKAPEPWGLGDHCVGKLPEGIPNTFPQAAYEFNPGQERMDWEHPAHNDGNAPIHHTNGSDPFPGMPGAR